MESRIANGTISPSVFVSLDGTTAGGKVIQCTAGLQIFGISQAGTRSAPFPALDDANAALVGEALTVYTFPDKEVYLQIGTGGCNPGDRLKATTGGVGIATTSANDEYGAIAKQSGVSGDLVPVDLVSPTRY